MNKTKLLLSLAMLIPTLANADTPSDKDAWRIYANKQITVTSKDGQYKAMANEDVLAFVKLEPCNYVDDLSTHRPFTVRVNTKDVLMNMECGITVKKFMPANKETLDYLIESFMKGDSVSAFFTEFSTNGFREKTLELYDLKQELKKQSEEEKQ
ncbi:hypothetical protein [Vibrio diabolicus]|uniref:hypothetical protein n=1 Tax=Vibrio diabolicus TaxID=50719 RepID=UPI0021602126|nr:hypothetical protein [Vibrio diabolicus]MCS0434126.1 hypothetical protein [Vibrio diabolicus]